MEKFDVIVIGGGPGGYVCAIRLAQLGFKTAIIEKNKLGGTCLNVGCIPSKALLDSSEHFHHAKHKLQDHGIAVENISLDIKKMFTRKDSVVSQTVAGVEYLMKKNNISHFTGIANFESNTKVKITAQDHSVSEIEGNKIIIATGSIPSIPHSLGYDGKRIISSTEALRLAEVPKKLVVIGGGVIGLELGSVYARLGSEVEVIEFQDRIIPTMDSELSKELQKVLKKLGIKFHLNHAVRSLKNTGDQVEINYIKNGTEQILSLNADYVLVAIGRKPCTDSLAPQRAGVLLDDQGRVIIDDNFTTNIPNIYAIGDVVRGAMLAHKAEEEGVALAELLAGQKPHINYDLIPGVVYTWPEVAAVGKTTDELKVAGIPHKIGKYPIKALGRARASEDIEGFVKVIAHKETDEILGVHIIAARAADLIMEGVALMEFRASAEDMSRICHPHPTYSEATKEAALAAWDNRNINM